MTPHDHHPEPLSAADVDALLRMAGALERLSNAVDGLDAPPPQRPPRAD